MHGEETRARRRSQDPLARSHGTRHAGAVGVRLFRCAPNRAEALRDHADQIGVRDIDFGIDHRDGDIGAPHHAVNVGHLELLENVLRGVASAGRYRLVTPGPGRRGPLLQRIDIVRLRDRHELHGRQCADDVRRASAVGDTEPHRGRSGHGKVLRRQQSQSELGDGSLQPIQCDIAGDLQDHLVLDEAAFVRRRDVDDPGLEAGRQLLAAASRGWRRRGRRRLRRQLDGALNVVDDRRGAERGKLHGAGQVLGHLCLLRR